MKAKLSLLIILFFGLAACSDNALIDQNIPIKNKAWLYEQKPLFPVHITNKDTPYHLYLNLRNSIDYPFSNIFILIHQQNPDKTRITYRVEVKLANPEGLWKGKSAGSLISQQVRFLKDYHFTDTGKYTFQFEQNMRVNGLKGISDIGLRIEPATPITN
ncbi:gliding motility lipoprotein GldH [Albibacterium bauzanense]|uniref:Gliding motility-associated lipoprotein GldH n=1 Tax=Albibacterium bauzanense TaxID=653929 RepID=A0A4V2PXS1_9SPHI|nr:gliding motility lipoprotein GldH [Albibacterium bauzanense]TCK83181.1 gliding motility-associated lipoprotein GldH [Albibacterium bauzanense]